MAFLNNSGDIIVDAVLTDVGRERLARGLPIISQFALGDTEIDYGLYDPENLSGSAYYDLGLLQTPIFEPSTYSQTAMGSKLFSYPDNTLQYLPVLKLNQSTKVKNDLTTIDSSTLAINVLATDGMITLLDSALSSVSQTSLIDGRRNASAFQPSFLQAGTGQGRTNLTTRFLRVGQGFDSPSVVVPLGSLEETNFSIFVNRLFLKVIDKNSVGNKEPVITANSFSRTQATDVYKVSSLVDQTYFGEVEAYSSNNSTNLATSLAALFINGVGRELQFSLELSDFLASNPAYYFSTYGQSFTGTIAGITITGAQGVSAISTFVRVVADNFGFAVDIPVKLFYTL